MKQSLRQLFQRAEQALEEVKSFSANDLSEVEDFRIKYLGRKGLVKELLSEISSLPPDQRKDYGQLVNQVKEIAQQKVDSLKKKLERKEHATTDIDLTRPADPLPLGSRHPIALLRQQLIDIFQRIGFSISKGPEIEDDWHNFGALNIPEDHPARDMQDTFFIKTDPTVLLRTHTSSVQVRVMENTDPPIRTISPGRVYRNETISARAHCQFHQVEGLYIDTAVSFADLKQTLYYFARELFGGDIKTRFRPSYFPFTEPSAEMDISCLLCKGEGCKVCKTTGWLEVLGCGMVDPNVLTANNIDPEQYTGYAFGIGIERLAMLKYQIHDLRTYFQNDIRFLQQFTPLDK